MPKDGRLTTAMSQLLWEATKLEYGLVILTDDPEGLCANLEVRRSQDQIPVVIRASARNSYEVLILKKEVLDGKA